MDCMIVSYISGVDGSACSHHIDDRIPYFKKSGIDANVITSFFAPKISKYNQSRVFFFHPEEIRNYLRFKLKDRIHNRVLYGLLLNLCFLPLIPFNLLSRIILPRHDQSLWWSIPASAVILNRCRTSKPAILYSTGGSHSAHLAAALASRYAGIPWIAEFQDPPIHGYCSKSNSERKFILWMERMIMKRARKVIFLTENAKKVSEERTNTNGKGMCIYPGSDPSLFESLNTNRSAGNAFTISHIGSLGGERNLRNFLRALEGVIEKEPLMASETKVQIIGGVGKELKQDFGNLIINNIIKLEGKLPRKKVLKRMAATDLLVIVQGLDDVSFGTIPSKTYEYMFTEKPILGLLYHNDELSDMLTSRGHYTAKGDDVDDIREALLKVYAKWKEGTLNNEINQTPITVQNAVDQLASLFQQINEKPSVSG